VSVECRRGSDRHNLRRNTVFLNRVARQVALAADCGQFLVSRHALHRHTGATATNCRARRKEAAEEEGVGRKTKGEGAS
jgi:hypothetical protein